jgi:hypothetical protein
MKQLIKIVIKRLVEKGMDINLISSFIRDVANINPSTDYDLTELNRRLSTLGWYDLELDYHTFQLIDAIIENELFLNKTEEKQGLPLKFFSIPALFGQSMHSHLL